MQDKILLAFRKRAKKRGYKEITIKKARDKDNKIIEEYYTIKAKEPISGSYITATYKYNIFDKILR